MILKFKTSYNNAMPLMETLLENDYHPVMSTDESDLLYTYIIGIDTDDVVNKTTVKKDYCDLKLDYLKKPCTPDCPDFEECWGEAEDSEPEFAFQKIDAIKPNEEEVANAILKALFESAGKNSRILNE